MSELPVVVHIIYRLDIGGMETVLVEFLNNCPEDTYQHVIIALTKATSFRKRITNKNVSIKALNKKEGKDFNIFFKISAMLGKLKPKVVHTYNMACLEYQLAAFLNQVPLRIHAEHGRDNTDIYGENRKYNLMRRVMDKFVHYWVPVSKDLETWLIRKVRIPARKVKLIYNGVDTDKFRPDQKNGKDKRDNNTFLIGTIGRLDPVKNHDLLVDAFLKIIKRSGGQGRNLQLKIIGEGPERERIEKQIQDLKLQESVDMPGACDNICEVLNTFDIFVLSSKAEGIPMTVLEACACNIAVVSTCVGGIPEIFDNEERIGTMVPSENSNALAYAIQKYMGDPQLSMTHGLAGRKRVLERFSIVTMTRQYQELYSAD